jgi:hypothetical protein
MVFPTVIRRGRRAMNLSGMDSAALLKRRYFVVVKEMSYELGAAVSLYSTDCLRS